MLLLRAMGSDVGQKRHVKRQVRFKDLGRDAKALGVDPSHLWRVLAGERSSRALMARYRGLKSRKEISSQ